MKANEKKQLEAVTADLSSYTKLSYKDAEGKDQKFGWIDALDMAQAVETVKAEVNERMENEAKPQRGSVSRMLIVIARNTSSYEHFGEVAKAMGEQWKSSNHDAEGNKRTAVPATFTQQVSDTKAAWKAGLNPKDFDSTEAMKNKRIKVKREREAVANAAARQAVEAHTAIVEKTPLVAVALTELTKLATQATEETEVNIAEVLQSAVNSITGILASVLPVEPTPPAESEESEAA